MTAAAWTVDTELDGDDDTTILAAHVEAELKALLRRLQADQRLSGWTVDRT